MYKYGCDIDISFKRLSSDDENIIDNFECGNPSLSNFFRYESLNSKRNVTYVFVDNGENSIICFCSICCNGILTLKEDIFDNPSIIRENIPAIEIDYFAVDERYKSLKFNKDSKKEETLSRAMFLYMIEYIRNISKTEVGAEKICLYSVPQAQHFYERCGFEDFSQYMVEENKPYIEGCVPLYYNL